MSDPISEELRQRAEAQRSQVVTDRTNTFPPGTALPVLNDKVILGGCSSNLTAQNQKLLVKQSAPLDTDVGLKYDSDKPDMSLFSSIALYELAKVLSFGKNKYAAHNWRKGIARMRLIGAALRHIFSYLGGEDKDPETGLSHIAHAMCCCMFILELEVTMPQTDDRYKAPK